MTEPSTTPALRDGFGRVHRALRLSVTDRCNLRCRYCMPAEGMEWLPGTRLMDDAEVVRLVGLLARMGVAHLRVTGGEPLVRAGVTSLIARLAGVAGVEEVALTTNGVLLADRIDALVAAGLDRVNISLDSLDPQRFEEITRRRDLDRVLDGIAAACAQPSLTPVKVNAVVMRGLNERDVLPLARMARELPVVVRFVEFMPIDAPRTWRADDVLTGAEVREMIGARWPIAPLGRDRPAAPGARFAFVDRPGAMIETVSSVSEPFCLSCDRLRLTADGCLRTCLFADAETDLLRPMRAGADDRELERLVREAVAGKGPGHGIADPGWTYAGRPMSRIGG